ncbi:MAG: transglutaminase-like domain-containing protein [Candidatus Lokiarchaeota archaeon]
MSEFRDDLLVSSTDKKRVIKTILLVGLLITLFAFSTVLFSLLWGGLRVSPNDQLSKAEREDAELINIPLTVNISDLSDLLDNITLNPDQIQDALDALQNMFDGNIDDLDLSDFATALLGLAASNVEAFRIYNDENFDINVADFFDTLWKYECFDEYNGTGWKSTAGSQPFNYYTYADYYSNPPLEDILKVQMPLTPSTGQNSMVIPTLFPNPYVMENSISAMNNYSFNTLDIDQTALYKDDYNCTTLKPYFINNDPVNMTYKMFGLDLPTDQEINMSAVSAIYTPAGLKNKYLKLPPSINVYRINHPNFNTHFNIINQTISSTDNAFQVASKIKNYLQSRFTLNYNPAPTGRDTVDWFCETGSGMPSDFASAFCAFTRSFGVVSRFVTGFNSFNISEEFDPQKNQHYFSIKYRNLYNWAEVYIPNDVFGNGRWIQMEAFPLPSNYSLSIYSNFTAGDRGAIAKVIAHLENNNLPVPDRIVYFYDDYYNQYIGQSTTDPNGNATIFIDIDDSQIVGPHIITAYYGGASNFTQYMVHGDIQVTLTDLTPANVTLPTFTNTFVQGYVSFRADVNNTWSGMSYPFGNMYDSSNLLDFNVSHVPIKKLLFYIDGAPSNIPEFPAVDRSASLKLTAVVLNETNSPLVNQNIEFHDYSLGTLIGTNTTNTNGIATWDYPLGFNNIAGPNLLYAKLGSLENYSYFILNEEPEINIYLGPVPREINRTSAGATNTLFHIAGNLTDRTNGTPLRFAELSLRLLRGGTDFWFDVLPSNIIGTDFNGNFDTYLELDSDIPTGNYTLRMDFNGTIDFNWMTPYPYSFILPNFNTSAYFTNQLKASTTSTLLFNFWINGTTSTQYDQPIITKNGDLNLSVFLRWGSDPIGDGEIIYFYDVTQDAPIGSGITTNGTAQIIYQTNSTTIAGPHLIYAKWGSNYNYSYFILDSPIFIDLISGPTPNTIYRTDNTPYTFNLHGYVRDYDNSNPIKYTRIDVFLFQGTNPVNYLVYESGSLQLNATGEFNLYYSVQDYTPEGNYTIQIEFDGEFNYQSPFNQFNEYYYHMPWITNFVNSTKGIYELNVQDYENLNISLSVEGNPTVPYYDDIYPPEHYIYGQTAHFQVNVVHSDITGNTVRIYDEYNNILLQSYTFPNSSGFVQFNISTTLLQAGLNKIRVEFHSFATINITYIIIDKPFTISATPNQGTIQREIENLRISGFLRDGTNNMRNLIIGIRMFDDLTDTDVTGLYLSQPYYIHVSDGSYQFDNQIALDCPQGNYYFRIDFNGSIYVPFEVNLTDYLGHISSSVVPITITAGTNIIQNSWYTDYDLIFPQYSDQWIVNDTIHILGSLEWDNGSAMAFMFINVTVKLLDGTVIAFNDTVQTDFAGNFHARIFIGQNNPLWPRYRDDTEIVVSFNPIFNGLQYVESSESKYL